MTSLSPSLQLDHSSPSRFVLHNTLHNRCCVDSLYSFFCPSQIISPHLSVVEPADATRAWEHPERMLLHPGKESYPEG